MKEEIDNGISLIMCQTEKGEELLELTPFHLDNINIDEALKNNHQLRHPAIMPPKREQFFKEIKKGRNYNAVIARIYPKICLKQKIKNMIFVFRNSKKIPMFIAGEEADAKSLYGHAIAIWRGIIKNYVDI